MRTARVILLFILIAALLPYLYACFFALPFADDFCFGWTASENISFAQKFLKQYLHWNGRYTSDVLVNFHPLITGSLFWYQMVSVIAIVAYPYLLFVLIRPWLSSSPISGLAALFMSLVYLGYQPNITEGVYWYIGVVNYHLGSLCFILQLYTLGRLLQASRNQIFLLAASLLFLIVSIGFNEEAATLIPAYYLAAVIYIKSGSAIKVSKQALGILVLHFAIAFCASLFVIFSPGNFTRACAFPERLNILHSVYFASLQTIRFIGLWGFSFPFIALSLIVVTYSDKVKSEFIKKVDYRFLLILLVFTVFMGAFLPYMATGILGQHRTMNFVFPLFLLLWIAVLLSASEKYQLQQKLKYRFTDGRIMALAFAAVIVMTLTGNSVKILKDVKNESFQRYRSEFMQRQERILKQPLTPIAALKNIPNSFQVVDTRADTIWWVDKCMKRYYTETTQVIK